MRGGQQNQYECGYVWQYGKSRGGVNTDNLESPEKGFKNVNASVVGCSVDSGRAGRTLIAYHAVADGFYSFAGGFAIGNITHV